jgi:hypothetical protein
MNQNRADTGRYTASGGKGLFVDGYSGVNCQNIPTYNKKDPNSVDIRKSLVSRPGKKIVTIDYSGEELRIATNLSKEPKWLDEFINGTGDLHTITGKIIYKKDDIDKQERGVGKTVNFLSIYGGGAGGLSQTAKIPFETAKRMLVNFFKEYKGFSGWIKDEAVRAKNRGFSRTGLGRRRPLKEFYTSPDKGIQAKGDRCAINSAVQGTGADVLKIALYRVWKWIHADPERMKHIRILMPVHDEIVYEITETKMEDYIPELSRIMKLDDITEKLGWEVKFEVDAEYGDSFSITHDFKDYYENGEYERILKIRQKEEGIEVEEEPAESGSSSETEKEEESEGVKATGEESLPEVPADKTQEVAVEELKSNNAPQNKTELTVDVNVAKKEEAISIEIGEVANTKAEDDIIDPAAVGNPLLKDKVDSRGYFNYVFDKGLNEMTASKISIIFKMLQIYDEQMFMGPSCRIKLLKKSGEVLLKTRKKFNIDAFVALCLWNEI